MKAAVLSVFSVLSLLTLSLCQTATSRTVPTTATSANASAVFTRWCAAGNTICVAAIPLPSAVNPTQIQFTMWSATASWLGFGPGTGMSDADVYIGWNSAVGNRMIVSDRTCAGQTMPSADAVPGITAQAAIPVQLTGVVPATSKTFVTFTRPLAATAPNKVITKGANSFIWAYGLTRPAQDLPTSTFSKHDNYGSIVFDFLSVGTTQQAVVNSPILTVPYSSIIHGILMTVAWTICPMAGIFVARYLKDMMGKWWYYTHVGLMLGGSTIISTAGIVFIVLTSAPPHFSLAKPHKPIGLAIGIDAILQAILGFVCNHMWSPERRSIPWWDILHWWNGRLLTILALVNVYLGLQLMNAGLAFTISFFVFVGVSLAALVAGQFYFGQVHHVKKDDDEVKGMEIGRPYDNNTGYNQGYGNQYGNNKY